MTLPAGKTASELGFKVGDKFRVVVGDEYYKKGDIVTLTEDDDSSVPKFKRGNDNQEWYEKLSSLEPLQEPPKKKETLTRKDFSNYSDNVQILWTTGEISIDDVVKSRDEWQQYWSRIGNVLRRKR